MTRRLNRAPLAGLLIVLSPALGAAAETSATDDPAAFDCVIMPHAVIDVSSGVSGRLEAVNVERGDAVRKDQVVAELESGVEKANVALSRARASIDTEINLTQANLHYDKRKKDRTETLYETQAVSPQELDQADKDAALARWRVRQAKDNQHLARLELDRAEELLKLRSVRSPISGVVVERFRWPGEFVEEEPVIRVAELDPLRVETILPVEMHGSIKKGMKVSVMPETEPGKARVATVAVVDPMGDPASGTFRASLELPNPGHRLLGGIKCTASIEVPANVAETSPAARTVIAQREPVLVEKVAMKAPTPPGKPVTEAVVLIPSASPVVEASNVVADTERSCGTVGPLPTTPEHIERIDAVFTEPTIGASLRDGTEIATVGYIVLAAGHNNRAISRNLRANGVKDYLKMSTGPFKDRISLGVYNGPLSAARRAEMLERRGIETEVQPRTKSSPVWWLDFELTDSTPREALDLLDALDANAAFEFTNCSSAIAARD